MFTSFFEKSRPINFVVVALFFSLIFIFGEIGSESFGWNFFLEKTGILLLLLFSMILLNFIARKNELTGRNSYKIVIFASFAALFIQGYHGIEVVVANIFILLALRRIISLRSQRKTKQKVFDASFWICIASLFYFWSILFIFLVFFGILVFVRQNYKNWLLPIIAFLTVAIIYNCIFLFQNNSFFLFQEWYQENNFNFSAYQQLSLLIHVAFLLALIIWCSFSYRSIIEKTSSNLRASHTLIYLCLTIAIIVAFFGTSKDGSEVLFALAPASLIISNYLQVMSDKWFKEILFLLIIILPVAVLFFF